MLPRALTVGNPGPSQGVGLVSPRSSRWPGRGDRAVGLCLLVVLVLAGSDHLAQVLRAQDAPAATRTRRAPEKLNFANGLLRDRRYDMAAEEYEAFLASRPGPADAADARFGLATVRWFLGQYQPARQQFEQFLQEAPDHAGAPTAWFRVGESAYLLGDLPAVRKALQTYTERFGEHRYAETAWTYLGEILLPPGRSCRGENGL